MRSALDGCEGILDSVAVSLARFPVAFGARFSSFFPPFSSTWTWSLNMSVVHYKFKNNLDYKTISFDGLSISLGDLKRAIMAQNKTKNGEFRLEIKNAQNNEGEELLVWYSYLWLKFKSFKHTTRRFATIPSLPRHVA